MLNSLKYFITGVNYILRTICISLVAWIGYKTETLQLIQTTNVTFVVQFFNTGFLMLLINANTSQQPVTFGLTGGPYSDFDDDWFRIIGNTLIGTLVFTSYFPIMEAFGYWGMRLTFRWLDGWSLSSNTTETKSIKQYVDNYAGPLYSMHYKYAGLLNITFITFMYGFGIPVLFPISAFAILVMYLVEKTMLFYAYQQPPMYDEQLSKNVLKQMMWAPVFYCAFGFWMATNKQMDSNDHIHPRPYRHSPEINDHVISTDLLYDALFEAPAWPLYVCFLLFLTYQVLGGPLLWCVKRIMEYKQDDFDELIPNYFEALSPEDKKWTLEEERNANENIGL